MRTSIIVGFWLTVLAGATLANDGSSQATIHGTIVEAVTGNPVVGASVLIEGTNLGCMTNDEGRYSILRVDTGTYSLIVTHVAYNTVVVRDVIVLDTGVCVDLELTAKATDIGPVMPVLGQRNIIDKFVTENKAIIDAEAIKTKPVQNVDAVLQTVTGVRTSPNGEVFIRGGRAGEVSYIVRGVEIGDPAGGMCTMPGDVLDFPHGGNAHVNNAAASAMFFKHYGVNPFVDTEDDRLSTFAIDIDDASYIIGRTYLNDGHLPPNEAIRTEEFVNHFDYSYPAPQERAFEVYMDGAPSKFGTENMWMLRIGIKGMRVAPENRKPANLVFVVDVSSSMAGGNRLGLVRQSLRLLLDELGPEDRVGIVTYESTARRVLNPTSIRDRIRIVDAVEALLPNGNTNAEAGLRMGYRMADAMYESGKINRIILCSDGVANVGRTGADQILEQIKQYADKGITLSSIGFGMGNYNDVLLEKLGNKGNGYYAYVDNLEDAGDIFVDNLTGALQVIARDVKIQVDLDPKVVRSYRLLGYENRDVEDDKFRDDTEDGGEIGSGHSVTALYEVKLWNNAPRGKLGTVYVRFKDPDTRSVTEVKRDFTAARLAEEFAAAAYDFRLACAAAEFAEILRDSYWARDGDLEDVLALATQLYNELGDKEVLDLMGLIAKADQFADQRAEK